ncbi:RNA-binding protein 12-like [Chiloscyllium plagiosum]|uniref:RNA-binding protein 12-like n=1 Tax=Chiloscyllium plagiosum TaxID=36176 RepID=UPI001CB8388D|nr:RNA-binding protein 12-like [Chiloscyllium plagiosum]XP_043544003.1 RNA-binding protein 12-like [Chiloscyllium plagiosum]XP_043544004.1 RNA-binding protein 12-like [Chiloscyllium plagiosum]XP_043544005.1 RNA-binding protein 12-like [Chiloscyllium plagiosum]XP_043544006.1 RNA-binding protein 12-like [Chiloscyllium plagiosum]
MAVVIRLQGLPVSAGTLDIRHFFSRLTIPDGGVHIIGGELGEAFIVFATDEDARLALMRSGEFLKGSRTKLTLSSRNEMQSTIEMSRKRYARSSGETSSYGRSGFSSSGTGGLGSMSSTLAENLVAAMQHEINRDAFHPGEIGSSDVNSYGSRMDPMMSGNMATMALSSPQNIPVAPSSSMSALFGMTPGAMSDSLDKFNGSGSVDPFAVSAYNQRREQGAFHSDDVYLHLQGMPYSAGELQVREFFHGLQVEAVRLQKDYRGMNNGECFVRFASSWDAAEGLKRHKKYMGQRFVEVYRATELEWISGGSDLFIDDRHLDLNRHNRGRSPHREDKHFHSQTRSRSPRRHRSRSYSPQDQDYWMQLKNIPYSILKKDIRNFFDELNITDDQIYLVEDPHGKNTNECFVKFRNDSEIRKALRYHKTYIANRAVYLYPVAKKAVIELMDAVKKQRSREKSAYRNEEKRYQSREGAHSPRLYIYARNLPFDISKSEIHKFFEGFGVAEHGIRILVDSNGIGLGEALVKFKSEDEVLRAERLYGKKLGGREVVLKVVTSEEVFELGNASMHERAKGQKESDYFGSYGGGGGGDHSLSHDMHELSKPFFEPSGNLDSVSSMQGPMYGREEGTYGGFNTGNSNFDDFSGGGLGSRFDSGYRGRTGVASGMAVVKAFNLPFKISVDEILDFFYGYRVIQESVIVRYNKRGFPAGDAIITFETVDEAMAAVRELNDKPIGKRNVKLSLL